MTKASERKDTVEPVLKSALTTIGLDFADLAQMMGISSSRKWDGASLGAVEFFEMCQILRIDAGFISYGYHREIHRHRIAEAWRQGELDLPRTPQLRALLKEARIIERENRRFRDAHYGLRLRWKVRFGDLKTFLRQLPLRVAAEIRARGGLLNLEAVSPRLAALFVKSERLPTSLRRVSA